jgi:hypothetical protein
VVELDLGGALIGLHERLTVIAGLTAADRHLWLDAMVRVLDGRRAPSRFIYVDDIGQQVEVRHHDDGDTTVAIVGDAVVSAGPDDQGHQLPRLVVADALPNERAVGPQQTNRTVATLISRARVARGNKAPTVVALDEPLAQLDTVTTWNGLDLVARLADTGQIVLLTDDIYVVAWARERAQERKATLLMVTDPRLD